jgi:hypothetical protein
MDLAKRLASLTTWLSDIDNSKEWLSHIDHANAEDIEEEPWSRECMINKQENNDKLQLIAAKQRENGKFIKTELQTFSRTGTVWAGLIDSIQTDQHGLIRYQHHMEGGSNNFVLLPPSLWTEAVHQAHHEAAHMGVAASTLAKHVEEVILACGHHALVSVSKYTLIAAPSSPRTWSPRLLTSWASRLGLLPPTTQSPTQWNDSIGTLDAPSRPWIRNNQTDGRKSCHTYCSPFGRHHAGQQDSHLISCYLVTM